MLSGSTFLRVAGLVVVAAVLAGLVQRLWPSMGGVAEPRVATAPAAPRPAPTPRVIRPADPVPSTGMAGTQAAVPAPVQVPAQNGTPAPGPVVIRPQPVQPPSPTLSEVPPNLSAVPPMAAEPSGDEAVADAIDSAGPRALGSVDLNNASLADLNGLRGGGMIGRAIVQKRPYTSVGELLSKRVLSRSTYERIKDQVTVR
ncbi:helix-hairpin-helix domain-containing protein [Methylobacterium sp. BTF04]|uniref:ComEA family DNA-binding protein n=1 Tax=Methylobacterium sp. BTF04 TaxID=2708300 RepID=UPI001FED8DC4|nr:helix-hairpin-helix domain-containing protein [Methylobacterium sp. BTF04]